MIAALAAAGGTVKTKIGANTVDALAGSNVQEILGDRLPPLSGTQKVLVLRTGSLPGLAPRAAVEVDGVAHKVSTVHEVDDGVLTVVVIQ